MHLSRFEAVSVSRLPLQVQCPRSLSFVNRRLGLQNCSTSYAENVWPPNANASWKEVRGKPNYPTKAQVLLYKFMRGDGFAHFGSSHVSFLLLMKHATGFPVRLLAPGICWSTQAPWGPSSQSVVVPWPWLLVCCSVGMEEMWPSLTGIRDRSFFQKHCFVCLVVMAEYWYTRSDFLFQTHLHMMRSWPGNSVNHRWQARVISLQYSTDFK